MEVMHITLFFPWIKTVWLLQLVRQPTYQSFDIVFAPDGIQIPLLS